MITLLAVAAEDASGAQLLVPAAPELIWGFVAFALLMLGMMKFVFPKANQVLEERSAAIQGKMEDADAKLVEAEEARRNFDAQIADARGEANAIIEDAKATAESLRRDIVAKAETEAAAIVSRAQADINAERDRALQELRMQVGAISVELASRIVERELDPTTHQSLVDDYIQRLASQN
ncbi:F0F1 ATP synthase subunit B [Egicoccus halophilus]|uniref:ATP synthase subunit b n=1 Tax=Egicoccus halophilus TaxID=1670830 RepID=A0A8J3ACT9_9ACTN|nr:F0F1 ATP synthase subunit B [Egicoccus halophilus]GGI04035.1 ATP synthase subunit b [Egicoccus halophilus]